MNFKEVEEQINKIVHERLFTAIKNISLEQAKELLYSSEEYKRLSPQIKKERADQFYKNFFSTRDTFYLHIYSIFSLYFLYLREKEINEFEDKEIYRVRADYRVDGIDFYAYYPMHFTADMQKEINQVVHYLSNENNTHIVGNYKDKKDVPKSPHHPLTNASLKYSGFYIFNFKPEFTTYLALKLYHAGLITNPNTNGWHIDVKIAKEMIINLSQIYNENEVLQQPRKFIDKKTDRSAECIRPINVTVPFFPKNLAKNERFNSIKFDSQSDRDCALKLYDFIFYITLSTQMKDSIYDRSKLTIKVGEKELVQEANYVIDGQKNWEKLTGNLIKRLNENTDSLDANTTYLPTSFIQGQRLTPVNVYSYSYNARKPPRYGVGRFVTQILESSNIATNEYHDLIVGDVLFSKACKQVQNILYPQEPMMFLFEFLEKYLPEFTKLDFLETLKERIFNATLGLERVEYILNDINELINKAFTLADYTENDSAPSEQKIKLVRATALKHNIALDENILLSNSKCDIFMSQFPDEEQTKICKCPNCENGSVIKKEYVSNEGEVLYYFACDKFSKKEGSCNFSIWDSYVYSFFNKKGLSLNTVEDRMDMLKNIATRKRGYLVNDLKSTKNESITYNANILLTQKMNNYNNKLEWGFELKFKQK